MITVAEAIAWTRHETACTIHIAKRLTPAHLEFRFTPPQRSTVELLRYLAIQNQGVLGYLATGSWDHWDALATKVADLDLAGFPAAMKRQQKALEKALTAIGDRGLKKTITGMDGKPIVLGQALMDSVLKMSVAYKMQLFLQAKAAGIADIGSSDLWRGKKAKPAKAKKA
jgi:hypothetical protein